ncbi:MAG: hypothetical protein OQJ89_05155 [Kangiellaceae bacterium]|nr:hypothetical protein [Kangiellaceae bacterium]MCW9016330.1 hypothetical protein [Kangiellaceae bacterium]
MSVVKEVDATPFTKRLHYSVEEISIEEFMDAVAQHRDNSGGSTHIQFFQSKLGQSQN